MDNPLTYPVRQLPGPNIGMVSACEVLTWIGLGSALTTKQLQKREIAILQRWHPATPEALLVEMKIREGLMPPIENGVPVPRLPARVINKVLRREGKAGVAALIEALETEIEARKRASTQLDQAMADLKEAIRSGKLVAWGRLRSAAGTIDPSTLHEIIPAELFVQRSAAISLCNDLAGDYGAEEWEPWTGPQYADVCLETKQVLGLWPPQTGKMVDCGADPTQLSEVSPWSNLSKADGAARSKSGGASLVTQSPTDVVTPDKSGPDRPKPTISRITAWLRERVANWPDDKPAPSEKKDWIAARAHFGEGLRRDQDFRPMRQQEVPPEWKMSGPRKPWGEVKKAAENSAENCAKLRPQH